MLMLGREVRTPMDIVYGTPEERSTLSYDDYADELENRLKSAFSEVWRNTGQQPSVINGTMTYASNQLRLIPERKFTIIIHASSLDTIRISSI